MQRRYTLLAAAMVLLVLVPGAVMAAGFSSGFGPKCSPLGQKTSQGAPDWAGNATALRANASAGAGTGTCLNDQICDRDQDRTQLRDETCLTNQDRDRDRSQLRDQTCQTNQVCDGDQDRDQVRDRSRINRTASSENGKRFALQGQSQRGQGR